MHSTSINLPFPGISLNVDETLLLLRSHSRLRVLSSAVVGGGDVSTQVILSRHVDKSYRHPRPAQDLQMFARQRGITDPFVGLMTAVFLHKVITRNAQQDAMQLSIILTAGFGNATAAGLSPSASPQPGTINIIALLDANLSPAARVNAIITITEAKTALLQHWNLRTPENFPATGTSTDAVVLACTGRGPRQSFAGPATAVGYLIGRTVRQALEACHP
jgi:iron complex transport system ATP-binding protein